MQNEQTLSGPDAIVTSLDWSKKLKEAGWPQESTFFWARAARLDEWEVVIDAEISWIGNDNIKGSGCGCCERDDELADKFAAPTAEEILRRLPRTVGEAELALNHGPIDGEPWYIFYPGVRGIRDFSLANAAAAMYCYLAENKLLS